MSGKVIKIDIPDTSILLQKFDTIDFQDAYAFNTHNNSLNIRELYTSIFSTTPKWVDNLMKLRNKLVSIFGLKTEMRHNTNVDFKVGDKIGIFTIYDILDDEIIAGENDKHLDFRVSVFREVNTTIKITVSTIVKYNNWFGKLYFSIVAPFHKLVVKSVVKKAAASINKSNYNDDDPKNRNYT